MLRRLSMTPDELIRTYMTAAGMIMEDMATKALLDPLAATRAQELRDVARELQTIADVVDAARKAQPHRR